MANPRADPRWLRQLGNPAIFAWSSAWLMVLLVVGTIDQKYHGLYAAQDRYFSSWLLWAFDIIPLPGTRLTLTIVFVCLVCFCFTRRALRKPGLLIAHIGAALLLLGGFLTETLRQEGTMPLLEGQAGVMIQSERAIELAAINESGPEHDLVIAFSDASLQAAAELSHSQLGFRVHVLACHRNAIRGPAGSLIAKPEAPDPEANSPAIEITVSGTSHDGQHILVSGEAPLALTAQGQSYRLQLRPARLLLPFSLRLDDVTARMHPGTDNPASFRSHVTVIRPNGDQRQAVISMNQPLRVMGYTIYQSHYDQTAEGERSGFTIAHDPVALLSFTYAYLSSIIMAIGLVIHLTLQLPHLLARKAQS
ncbi:MAG: cytochrome c biogenesis protein ResB [Planctomycetota bacterium]|jgi:hypothetical protein|nr:cytochrome c biogenesis protein ResB [Planctomycetota bacterium]